MLDHHGPTTIHLAKNACGYFTLSPPLPLHVPLIWLSLSLSPPLPVNHGAHLENKMRHSGCNLLLVTARVLYLPPCPCLCFFLFFPLPFLSLFTSGLNYSTSVRLRFVLGEINEATHCFGELHGGYYIPPLPICSLFPTLFVFH